MSRLNKTKLRAMVLKWRRTKDISLAHDICEYLSSVVLPQSIPIKYVPTEYKIEVKYGRH